MMKRRFVVLLMLALLPAGLFAQFTTPHLIAVPGPTTATLGPSTFVNKGLVGVGRLSASQVDPFGDSLGSASGLQITNWVNNGNGTYSGTANLLPDRGYNSGTFFADYAARINRVGFTFTPYTGAADLGGGTEAEKIARQNQMAFSGPVTGTRFTYDDPNTQTTAFTTGLDPAGFSTGIFGKLLPYVPVYTGAPSPGAPSQTFNGINKLALDSEALVIRPDGSGYVGDEYGANVYYFNPALKIVGAIVPPAAFQPHLPAGVLNFTSAANPVDGRRNNQGFEGVSLSPDGTRLFVLLQSAAVQDASAANNQNAKHTRLLIYDVSTDPTPNLPTSEYVLTLPTYTFNGSGVAVDRTCAQSEVIALDNFRFLVLSRDGNGLGAIGLNPSMYKSVLLVDIRLGNPTDIANEASRNMLAGRITTAPGVLDAAITPLQSVEALNMLNTSQLNKFNIQVDTGAGQVSKLTLGEKWEGMALTYAGDPANPNDYFLFIANDNDFLTSAGKMRGPGGPIDYNGFAGYPASRLPAAVGSPNNDNDTVFLVYRVTITPDPTAPFVTPNVTGTLGNNGWYKNNVAVTWTLTDPQSGISSSTGCGSTQLSADTAGTTLTCAATNAAGLTTSASVVIKLDKTLPAIAGLPTACSLWPANHKLVTVGTVSAADALSGLLAGSFQVTGTSNEAVDPKSPDVIVTPAGASFVVELRAERLGNGNGRIYLVQAIAADRAGNTANASATCVVPHDKGKGK